MSWEMGPGVVEFPDGVRVRGRGLTREACPDPRQEWGLYLLASPAEQPCPGRWVRWRDFWLPGDGNDARLAFTEAYHRAAAGARVEIACGGGKGRTGTALACIAQLGGVPAGDATAWVRAHYDPHAVETPWQRRFVRRFLTADRPSPGLPADGGLI